MEEEPGEQIDECSNMYGGNNIQKYRGSSREEAVRGGVMMMMQNMSSGGGGAGEGGGGSIVTEDSSDLYIHDRHHHVMNGDSSSDMQYMDNLYTREATGARTIRQTGGKDRHSKVYTSKGPRDRRVRLSVSTAIQFYDLQDRLGYDQPSKAVEWLILKAKPAIDRLPLLRFHLQSPPPNSSYNPPRFNVGPNSAAPVTDGPRPRPRPRGRCTPRSPPTSASALASAAPLPSPPPASSHSPPTSSLSLSGLDSPEPTASGAPSPNLAASSPATWDSESHTTLRHSFSAADATLSQAASAAATTITTTHYRGCTTDPSSLPNGAHPFNMQKPASSIMPRNCRKRPKDSDNGDDGHDDDDDDDDDDQDLQDYLEQNFTRTHNLESSASINPTISFFNTSATANHNIQINSNSNVQLLPDQWSTSLITQLMDETHPSSSHYLKENGQSLQLNQNLPSPSIASNLMSGCNQSDVFMSVLQYAPSLQMSCNSCDMASNLREEMNTTSCTANAIKQVDYVDSTSHLNVDSSNTSFPVSVPASYHSIDLYNTFEEAGPSFPRPSSTSMSFPYSQNSTTQLPTDMHHVFPATRPQMVPSFVNPSHHHHLGNFPSRLRGFDQQP